MSADEHWWFRPVRAVHRCGLSLSEEAETGLRECAGLSHPCETGGLLLGWWQDRVPVVVAAVEVPDPDAGHHRWSRDEPSAAQALERVRGAFPAHVGYVGDWHSHPADVGPSSQDLRAIRRASKQFDDPLVLAVARRGGRIDTRLAYRGRLTTVHALTTPHLPTNPPGAAL